MRFYYNFFSILILSTLSTAVVAGNSPWSESLALQAKGEYREAAQLLAIMPDSNNSEFAVLRIAYLNYLNGSYNDSINFYKRALTLNENSITAHLGITLPLMAQQRWRQVKRHANHVLNISPLNYSANIKLMIAEEGLAEWENLLNRATELAHYYPADATVYVYLARANIWLGNNDKAFSAYHEVLKRIPDHIEANLYVQATEK